VTTLNLGSYCGVIRQNIHVFLGHLSVMPLRNSWLVDVKFDTGPTLGHTDHRLAQENYIGQIIEYKFSRRRTPLNS
jgi:hypothetical protein